MKTMSYIRRQTETGDSLDLAMPLSRYSGPVNRAAIKASSRVSKGAVTGENTQSAHTYAHSFHPSIQSSVHPVR